MRTYVETLNSVSSEIQERVNWDVDFLVDYYTSKVPPLKKDDLRFKNLEEYIQERTRKEIRRSSITSSSSPLTLSIPSFEIRTDQNSYTYTTYLITSIYLNKTYYVSKRYSEFSAFNLSIGKNRKVKFPGKRRGRYYGDDVRRGKLEEWLKDGWEGELEVDNNVKLFLGIT